MGLGRQHHSRVLEPRDMGSRPWTGGGALSVRIEHILSAAKYSVANAIARRQQNQVILGCGCNLTDIGVSILLREN